MEKFYHKLKEMCQFAASQSLGRMFNFLLLGCVCLVLSGCGTEELYTNLSESDANTMMGVLLARNIKAQKTMAKEGQFTVTVPRAQFAAATELLKWYGLPKETFTGVGQVFQKTGIVSSPTEERIRFMFALSQNIAETLSQIDGVVTARVNLVLPNNDPYSEKMTPSSAAVFLKFRPGLVPPTLIPQIKLLVMNSVEGLAYDKVSVVIMQSESIDFYYPLKIPTESKNVSVLGVKVPREAEKQVAAILVVCILIAIGGLGAIGWLVYQKFWVKKRDQEQEPPPGGGFSGTPV